MLAFLSLLLLQGLSSKNKKTRVVCLEEIQRIVVVDPKGAAALGRAGVREVAVYLDSKVPPPPYTYTPPPPLMFLPLSILTLSIYGFIATSLSKLTF